MPKHPGQKSEHGYRVLPIGEIVESPLNPRKHFDPHKLEDLAASIKQHGILTPMLARPLPDGTVELAAGHRRFRAAQLAGLDTVPVIVRPMTDDQLLEVLTIENLQREDIHPMEEADGFARLIERRYTVDAIADKIGKPLAYVRGRLELCDLVPVVRESFLRHAITIGHARLISRLAPDKQEEALGMCFTQRGWGSDRREELATVSDLRDSIKHKLGAKDLSRAPFALDDGSLTANAPACTHCPRCTGVQRSLLADDTGEQTCLDPACYSQKLNAHIMRQTRAGLVAISTHYSRTHSGEIPPGVLVAEEYATVEADQVAINDYEQQIAETEAIIADPGEEVEEVEVERQRKILADLRADLADELERAKGCPFAEDAVIVHGRDYGPQVIGGTKRICRNPECPVHGEELRRDAATAARAARAGGAAKAVDPWKAKREKLDEKIKLEARRELTRQVWQDATLDSTTLAVVAQWALERAGHDGRQEICSALELEAKKNGHGYDYSSPLQLLINSAAEADNEGLLGQLIVLFCVGGGAYREKDLYKIAKHLNLDPKAIEKRIASPLVEKFNEFKAKAKAKAKEKAEKKPAAPKSSKMAAAGDEADADE
jgi:ParB/RepB/Spo0J family partition protein